MRLQLQMAASDDSTALHWMGHKKHGMHIANISDADAEGRQEEPSFMGATVTNWSNAVQSPKHQYAGVFIIHCIEVNFK